MEEVLQTNCELFWGLALSDAERGKNPQEGKGTGSHGL